MHPIPITLRSRSVSQCTLTAHRGCVHLIIDTEDLIVDNAAPADGEGSHPHLDEGEGGNAAVVLGHVSVEGEDDEPQTFSPFSSHDDPAGRVAAATTLELLQVELLHRLFPGVAPQLPSPQSDGASATATTASTTLLVQLQQSVVMLEDEGVDNDSAVMHCTACQAPPSVIGVSPAAVYCQLLPLSPLASPQDKATFPACDDGGKRITACNDSDGMRMTVWLKLSAPLPSEGVSLLARHRGALLAARFERADGLHDALTIKVRQGVMKCQCVSHSKPTRLGFKRHADLNGLLLLIGQILLLYT